MEDVWLSWFDVWRYLDGWFNEYIHTHNGNNLITFTSKYTNCVSHSNSNSNSNQSSNGRLVVGCWLIGISNVGFEGSVYFIICVMNLNYISLK